MIGKTDEAQQKVESINLTSPVCLGASVNHYSTISDINCCHSSLIILKDNLSISYLHIIANPFCGAKLDYQDDTLPQILSQGHIMSGSSFSLCKSVYASVQTCFWSSYPYNISDSSGIPKDIGFSSPPVLIFVG